MITTTLPNGFVVSAVARSDAESIYAQVMDYFSEDWKLDPEAVVVDLGANIGIFAMECLRRTAGKAKIVCCEPAPPTFESLRSNVQKNFPDADVILMPIGVSNQAGTVRFLYRPKAPAMSSLESEVLPDHSKTIIDNIQSNDFWKTSYGKKTPWLVRLVPRGLSRWFLKKAISHVHAQTVTYDCQLKTLSALIDECRLPRIDVLKIDVEGAEWKIFEGLEDRHWPLVQLVLAEVHDIDGRVQKCEALFRRHGLTDIHTDQEFVFRNTSIFNMIARRPLT